jgi:hypothetical protein
MEPYQWKMENAVIERIQTRISETIVPELKRTASTSFTGK